MSFRFETLAGRWLALVLLFGGSTAGWSQVTLSVSPAVVSNSYPGVITLTVTGLTNGEKITIQKWLDLNSNGSIDTGEPLVDAFKLTDNDNSNALISGITNLNVPFDTDPTPGHVSASLYLVPGMILENIVGQQIYRVVSPSGRFTPVTATLVVTNSALAQSASGVVYGPDGATPVPGAVVVAQDQQANNPAGAVVADGNGHFMLNLPPSSYALMCALPNYYVDQSRVPSFVLTNGMATTNALFLTNGGPSVISGNVYDAASSNSIGGLMLELSSSKLFAITFTDTNGNYSAAVTPSFWTIQANKQRLVRRAYVLPEAPFQVDASTGSVSSANIPLPRGNALIYGRVTDSAHNPFASIELDGSAGDSVNTGYDAKGYTDANGNYAVAILGDLTNYWWCNADSGKNGALANYVLNSFDGITNIPGQTTLQNFVALQANATISGHVQDNSGAPLSGVGLSAGATISGGRYQSLDATTDDAGNYSLAVAAGQWDVEFFEGGYSDALDAAGYTDLTSPHQVSVPPVNALLNITVYPIGTPLLSQPLRNAPGQFSFNVSGASNVNYTVQVSTNLASTNWATLLSFQLTQNPFPVVDTHATNSLRFYRVLKN